MTEAYNIDCMEAMTQMKDNEYDLAIVDPPYGGGQHFNFRFGIDDEVYDSRKPHKDYWLELFRISINQIVWGGNYFTDNLAENRCWISWYKGNPLNSFSDFELAWTNLGTVMRIFPYLWNGFMREGERIERVHPTEKPVALSVWILNKWSGDQNIVLDLSYNFKNLACVTKI